MEAAFVFGDQDRTARDPWVFGYYILFMTLGGLSLVFSRQSRTVTKRPVSKPVIVRNSTRVPQVLTIMMLVFALYPDRPPGYDTLLRWVCCGVFGYLASTAYSDGERGWAWTLGITAGVFNPLVPVQLDHWTWAVVDLIAAAIALVSIRGLSAPRSSTSMLSLASPRLRS